MKENPISRSDWASFDWREAQTQVALLFKKNGFKIFQEKILENNKRADIIVIKERQIRAARQLNMTHFRFRC